MYVYRAGIYACVHTKLNVTKAVLRNQSLKNCSSLNSPVLSAITTVGFLVPVAELLSNVDANCRVGVYMFASHQALGMKVRKGSSHEWLITAGPGFSMLRDFVQRFMSFDDREECSSIGCAVLNIFIILFHMLVIISHLKQMSEEYGKRSFREVASIRWEIIF